MHALVDEAGKLDVRELSVVEKSPPGDESNSSMTQCRRLREGGASCSSCGTTERQIDRCTAADNNEESETTVTGLAILGRGRPRRWYPLVTQSL